MSWIKKGYKNPNHNGENVLLTVKLGNAITVIEGWGDFYGFYSNKINITSEVKLLHGCLCQNRLLMKN
jgi:hypothetical protein